MSPNRVVVVDNLHVAELLGYNDTVIRVIEDAFPDVFILVRGNEISFTGRAPDIDEAAHAIEELRAILNAGAPLNAEVAHETVRMLRASRESRQTPVSTNEAQAPEGSAAASDTTAALEQEAQMIEPTLVPDENAVASEQSGAASDTEWLQVPDPVFEREAELLLGSGSDPFETANGDPAAERRWVSDPTEASAVVPEAEPSLSPELESALIGEAGQPPEPNQPEADPEHVEPDPTQPVAVTEHVEPDPTQPVAVLESREAAPEEPGSPSQVLSRAILSSRGRTIRPKTEGQAKYVDAIDRNTITFGIGPAGTGKTYLAMAQAVAALQAKSVNRIVLTRPAVEAGERLGFLPGSLSEKIDPYLRPLYDALHDMLDPDSIPRLLEAGTIEVAPLAYMRGRTLNDAFVILDEAQNTTQEQMKMFLTRLGFGSTMVVTGDVTQVDLPGGTQSGLRAAHQILAGVDDISFCHLGAEDVVRHRLVSEIVTAYAVADETGVSMSTRRSLRSDGQQRRLDHDGDQR